MPLDFGALIRGTARGVTGYEQGVEQRKEREAAALRQARMDLLKESLETAQGDLAKARTKKLNAPPGPPDLTFHGGNESIAPGYFNPQTGIYTPLPGTAPKAKAPELPTRFTGQDGKEYTFDAKTQTVSLAKGVQPGPKVGTGGSLRTALTQSTLADLVSATKDAENLEKSSGGDATKTGIIASIAEGAGKTPLVGPMLAGPGQQIATGWRSPDQQQYRAARQRWAIAYTHSLPGGSRSMGMTDKVIDAFFPPQGTEDPATIASYAKMRRETADRLDRARKGEPMDLSDLPGFESTTPEAAGAGTPLAPATPKAAAKKYSPNNPYAPK